MTKRSSDKIEIDREKLRSRDRVCGLHSTIQLNHVLLLLPIKPTCEDTDQELEP